jgi:hypothetical protein
MTFEGHILQVVMTPSSIMLGELRLSLVGAPQRPGFVSGYSFGTPPRGPAGQHLSWGLG